jgi:guanine deaminase
MSVVSQVNKGHCHAVRGSIFHCLRDPGHTGDPEAVEYFEDGMLLIENGHIVECGPAETVLTQLSEDIPVTDYSGKLIIPGFIDSHIHYPQTDIIASYGTQLLEWLNKYTYPMEARFGDLDYATGVAEFFLDELLRNGTTTAMVMPTVHPESVDAIFSVAQKRNMRVISGKKLMDRHAPDNLLDTPRVAYDDSRALIEKWHKCDRLLYAITPRFAPTSTDKQLSEAGRLAREYPDTYVHSHVAENHEEVAWVAELFPWSRSYLDVYDQFDLLRERSVFAHGIHLNDEDRNRLQQSGAALAFCPTSNTFLGSGLFDLPRNRQCNIRVGLATDVGGGTSFSMLQTLSDAYKVQQLAGNQLPPTQGIYLATLGSAEALYLEDKLGNFLPGKEADFVVLDDHPTALISRRMQETKNIDEKLFVFMMMGDDRAIYASFIMGECAYERPVINTT